METLTVAQFDPAEYLETKEDAVNMLKVALEENDTEFLLSVIGDIVRSKSMAEIARELNLDCAGLYQAFSPEGNPSFSTVVKALDHLGIRLRAELKSA